MLLEVMPKALGRSLWSPADDRSPMVALVVPALLMSQAGELIWLEDILVKQEINE